MPAPKSAAPPVVRTLTEMLKLPWAVNAPTTRGNCYLRHGELFELGLEDVAVIIENRPKLVAMVNALNGHDELVAAALAVIPDLEDRIEILDSEYRPKARAQLQALKDALAKAAAR